MLPSAKKSLQDGGFSPRAAGWTLVACFLGGVLGIQVISRGLHHFMPSHIVDCEHTHEDEEAGQHGHVDKHNHDGSNDHDHDHQQAPQPKPRTPRRVSLPGHMHRASSDRQSDSRRTSYLASGTMTPAAEGEVNHLSRSTTRPPRRPSLHNRLTSTISQFASGKDASCSCDGPCYGYSEPCGQECFKNINARGGYRALVGMASGNGRPPLAKSATTTSALPVTESTPLLHNIVEEPPIPQSQSSQLSGNAAGARLAGAPQDGQVEEASSGTLNTTGNDSSALHETRTNETTSSHHPDHHHHHVPTNAFLSIGLQTSIAIALHKLPEGFITYATNHANPKLGFAVFLALFIHNITEGFAMALPLYLAINNRLKAMLVSFVLGGLSQPLGAGVAALWFKLAGQGDWSPSEGVYGGMFAVTAGIMASVALQLFSESLDLTHSRTLCFVGAFTGMGVLGISSALTA